MGDGLPAGESIPDLKVNLPEGSPLEVELSAKFAVKKFEELVYFVQAAWAISRHADSLVVTLEYPDDDVSPTFAEIQELATDVYIALDDIEPPTADESVEIAILSRLGITVVAEHAPTGTARFVWHPAEEEGFADAAQLISGFENRALWPLKEKVYEEAAQLSDPNNRNVIALDLVHFPAIANVLRHDGLKDAFQLIADSHGVTWHLNEDDLPPDVDAVVLFWVDFYGRRYKQPDVYRNPNRS